MMYFERGSPDDVIEAEQLREGLYFALKKLGARRRVLVVPPDLTRVHSRAGELTRFIWEYYGAALTDILPAVGTHAPMTPSDIETMFPGVPQELFRSHDWRHDVITVGEVPASWVREISLGAVEYPWPVQVNRLIVERDYDLILSIGQVVPHEVCGMANYTKNILVGTGGAESINRSHFLGAVLGIERIMGKVDTPVRHMFNYAMSQFLPNLPIVYIHTVVSRTADGALTIRGLFIGDDSRCFELAAALSLKVNFFMLEHAVKTVVVWLDPHEFKSTWLGNKAIYRTRLAIADGGHLIILAPGVRTFGEDPQIDQLIRRYGYRGTTATLSAIRSHVDLSENLAAAAHLIHGSAEGRFKITYCAPHLSRNEIEAVGFEYADFDSMYDRYKPEKLFEGYNRLSDGENFFFVSNPALGLWTSQERFSENLKKLRN